MKRLVKPIDNETIHLSDIMDKVIHILICPDISRVYGSIEATTEFENDWEDMSDDQFYLTLPDSNLMELSKDEIRSITNLELIERIAKLDKYRLTTEQLKALKNAYKQKFVVDKSDVVNLINQLKECNSISYERHHDKTNGFLLDSNGRLMESECLEIIHQLTVADYVSTTKSYNFNHIGNQLFVFEPEADWEMSDGTILRDLKIYIKLDIDETTKFAVALVSMHKAEFDVDYPYENE